MCFSLKMLLCFVTVTAFACYALTRPTELVATISETVVFIALIAAVIVSALGPSERRPFWLGFSIAGWIYVLCLMQCTFYILHPVTVLEYSTQYLANNVVAPLFNPEISLSPEQQADVTRQDFIEVISSFWILLVAVLGGAFGKYVHEA